MMTDQCFTCGRDLDPVNMTGICQRCEDENIAEDRRISRILSRPPRKPARAERLIVSEILTWLNSLPGCIAVKRHGGVTSMGLADIEGCITVNIDIGTTRITVGAHFELEVKRPGQQATVLQEAMLSRWTRAGAVTAVVHSLDGVKALLLFRGIG